MGHSSSITVRSRDLIVPSTWEGSGDEIHDNDLHAREHGLRGRLVSGSGMVALVCAALKDARSLLAPQHFSWRFESPIYCGDVCEIEARGTDPAMVRISRDGLPCGGGTISWVADTAGKKKPEEFDGRAGGRTLTDGDVELFGWWMHSPLPHTPEGTVPWPLVVLISSGAVGRYPIARGGSSLVLRSYEWWFIKEAGVGETLEIFVHGVRDRPSQSRPGRRTWVGGVAVQTAEGDLVADSEWVMVYENG